MENRREVLDWLEHHREAIRGEPNEVLQTCEREVRRHAAADAWMSACEYLKGRRELWEIRGGYPVSTSGFVAREVCKLFARELRQLHPTVPRGSERDIAGDAVLALLDPTAWAELRDWVRELAIEEEEKTWKEIVKFTRERARYLPDQRAGIEADWETHDGTYGHAAAVIAGQLIDQYRAMARAAAH